MSCRVLKARARVLRNFPADSNFFSPSVCVLIPFEKLPLIPRKQCTCRHARRNHENEPLRPWIGVLQKTKCVIFQTKASENIKQNSTGGGQHVAL